MVNPADSLSVLFHASQTSHYLLTIKSALCTMIIICTTFPFVGLTRESTCYTVTHMVNFLLSRQCVTSFLFRYFFLFILCLVQRKTFNHFDKHVFQRDLVFFRVFHRSSATLLLFVSLSICDINVHKRKNQANDTQQFSFVIKKTTWAFRLKRSGKYFLGYVSFSGCFTRNELRR